MRTQRTSMDFSKHQHRVEIYKSGENEIRVDHFQVDKSMMLYIQFINTNEVMTVTGDFGNWVFCRPFHPSEEGGVSDHYWLEKLRMSSQQKFDKLDVDENTKAIRELIEKGLEDYGYEGVELQQAKEWFKELLEEVDDELDYLTKAYRDYDKPDFIDYEMIPCYKEIPIRLNIIFDAFDEICNRLK